MKLVLTADWHGLLPEDLPKGDVLAIVGDVTPVWDHGRRFQADWIKDELRPHLTSLPYQHVLLVGGNHDFVLQESKKVKSWFEGTNITYLQDEGIEIDGVKFHGSPWSLPFFNWAFMADEGECREHWKKIARDTDVLLVHGPPFGACDWSQYSGVCAGSTTLRELIYILQPHYFACGHIHEAYGVDKIGQTEVYNVSYVNAAYQPVNKPVTLDL